MNTPDKKDDQQKKEDNNQNTSLMPDENGTVHTINPFTGTEVDITPEDLEGIEKFKEAQTERD